MHCIDDTVPTLTPGLTYLATEEARASALYRLALAGDRAGTTYWIDAGNTASTYTLLEHGATPWRLETITLARAFTAYQHHTLVHELDGHLGAECRLVVAPRLGSLYADDDVPTSEAEALFEDILAALTAIAEEYDLPVLVTAHADDFADTLPERATQVITARETDMGTAYGGDADATTVYRGPGFWQTTIPYWAELMGHRKPTPAPSAPTQVALPLEG